MFTRRSLIRLIVSVTLFALAAIFGSGVALAQKKGGGTPPPPAPGTIYFQNWSEAGLDWLMKGDGTAKAHTIEGQPSYQLHGGSRWFLQLREGVGQWGQWFAVDDSNRAIQLTNDPDLHSNGYPPIWSKDDSFFSYVGVYETATEWIGRLFVVTVDWSGGDPVAGPPTMVLELRRSVFNEWGDWSYEGLDEVSLGRHDWSPNGSQLAVSRWVWGEGWVIDIVSFSELGVESYRLATRAANPEWSPNGNRIAFNREQRSGYQEIRDIWTIKPDGTDALRLTTYISGNGYNGTAQFLPTWSPDGAFLAYTERVISNSSTKHNIRRIPAAGGSAVSLTTDGKSSWSRWRP